MTVSTFDIEGRVQLLATAPRLTGKPAVEFIDGKPSGEPRRDAMGRRLFRCPQLAVTTPKGLLEGASVLLTEDMTGQNCQVGEVLEAEGTLSIRAANGFGLTGTFTGELIENGGN